MKINKLLNAALEYAGNGWHVFPLVPNKKTPLTRHGFLDATTNRKQIAAWWKQCQNANIGIATGDISGVVVVDIDDLCGMPALRKLTQKRATLTSQTQSGGWHLVFKYPGVTLGNRTRFLPGIDLRGDGGYIVAPPSVVNDRPYKFIDTQPVADLPPQLLAKLTREQGIEIARKKRARQAKLNLSVPKKTETVCYETEVITAHEINQKLISGLRMSLEMANSTIPTDMIIAMQVAAVMKLADGSTFRQAIEVSKRVLFADGR